MALIIQPPPPFILYPPPLFFHVHHPSLPVGQSEERSDGSSSVSGAGPGESSIFAERKRIVGRLEAALWTRPNLEGV